MRELVLPLEVLTQGMSKQQRRLEAVSAAVAERAHAAAAPTRPPPGWWSGVVVKAVPQAYPEPPADIAARRTVVPHGILQMIQYESRTVGVTRSMNVYTPPGYTAAHAVSHAHAVVCVPNQ